MLLPGIGCQNRRQFGLASGPVPLCCPAEFPNVEQENSTGMQMPREGAEHGIAILVINQVVQDSPARDRIEAGMEVELAKVRSGRHRSRYSVPRLGQQSLGRVYQHYAVAATGPLLGMTPRTATSVQDRGWSDDLARAKRGADCVNPRLDGVSDQQVVRPSESLVERPVRCGELLH